jgi:UDP-N-acetylglucosamine/UDP-N-acetylgalactosamine 4-epimerase
MPDHTGSVKTAIMKRTAYISLLQELTHSPRTWLVTGAAGFIGSNLVETLLHCGQKVVGLDNFATGHSSNLEEVRQGLPPKTRRNFRFIKGDITDPKACRNACKGVDYVLHQAALGSVPRSLVEPRAAHDSNVTGFLNMLIAVRDAKVKRLVYASSSSVYGDHPGLPKTEDRLGKMLSPYAATKMMNEIYAEVFGRCYGFPTIGLRYFNVFGPRQDPNGPYAAVIPKWVAALLHAEPVFINGDGRTSRDFCYVANAVQANLLAATTPRKQALNQIYNVALNERTTLNELFRQIRDALARLHPEIARSKPVYREFRPGDVRHSQADISRAQDLLGYRPTHQLADGLEAALAWYVAQARPSGD